jgi:hypothetical protein
MVRMNEGMKEGERESEKAKRGRHHCCESVLHYSHLSSLIPTNNNIQTSLVSN